MIIVKLKGGLGNQIFQYSFAKLLEKITHETVKLDLSAYDSLNNDTIRKPRILLFNISLLEATKDEIKSKCKLNHHGNSLSFRYRIRVLLENLINNKYFLEPNREYIDPQSLLKYEYFDGYWQSKKYVEAIRETIIPELTLVDELSEKAKNDLEEIVSKNSVFLGVRKGDYASEKKHYGVLTPEYYSKAMDMIESRVKNPVFYVFSNDIQWCKENLITSGHKVIFRNVDKPTTDSEDFLLMSSCSHAIISNSTYHWWAATLIKNPKKIICCPSKWFFDGKKIDIYEEDWIKIEV